MRTTGIWALALTTLISSQLSAAELPGKGITVQPLQSTISEETFQTSLVNKALENSVTTSNPRKKSITMSPTPPLLQVMQPIWR